MSGDPSDEALVRAFVGGDRPAFNDLVVRHQDRVYQFALWFAEETAEGADDLAQEIWLQVFRSAHAFRGHSSFKTWLYGVGRNVCLGWMRERDACVRAAVERLPSRHRVALLLREWEGLSYEEIAAALDLPLGTVRSRLHNALVKLSAQLSESFQEKSHEV